MEFPSWNEICDKINSIYGKNYSGHIYKYEFFTSVLKASNFNKPVKFLEIGSYEGISLVTTASLLRSINLLDEIVSVDPYFAEGYEETPPGRDIVWKDSTPETMRRAKQLYLDFSLDVELIRDISSSAFKDLSAAGRKFDLIFIDGVHEGLQPTCDVVLALQLLAHGGVLCIDDTGWPDIAPIAGLLRRNCDVLVETKTQLAVRLKEDVLDTSDLGAKTNTSKTAFPMARGSGTDGRKFGVVADGDRLSLSTILFVTTAKTFMPSCEICVGVPIESKIYRPEVARMFSEIFDIDGVEKVSLPAFSIFNGDKPYRIENKLNLMKYMGKSPALLCDSDLFFLRDLDWTIFSGTTVAAKPADVLSWNGPWEDVYRMFDLPAPKRRILTTRDKEISFPYFNAGVIFSRCPEEFGFVWYDTAKRITANAALNGRFPYADQIALPIAANRLNAEVVPLDIIFNYPIQDSPLHPRTVVLHHHDQYELIKKIIPKKYEQFCGAYGSFENSFSLLENNFSRK